MERLQRDETTELNTTIGTQKMKHLTFAVSIGSVRDLPW